MEFSLDLVDISFDPGQVENYYLSILPGQDGFLFCSADPARRQVNRLGECRHTHALENPAQPEPGEGDLEGVYDLLNSPFARKSVVFTTGDSTLVPPEHFRPGQEGLFMKFNYLKRGDRPQLMSRYLPLAGTQLITSVPDEVFRRSEQLLHGSGLIPACAVNIETLLRQHGNGKSRQVYIYNWGRGFDLMVRRGNSLVYSNTFSYKTAEDLVYYVVFVFEQLGIEPDREPVTLLGEFAEKDKSVRLLRAMTDNLAFAEPDAWLLPESLSSRVDRWKYFTLISSPFCGL